MKFLVFGFSVTAETGGFVERCKTRAEHECPEHEIGKVAIGGMQPSHARHLIEGLVRERKPEALIVEVATAIYRLRPRSNEQIADHIVTMEAIFDICQRYGIRCGILDLPQVGIRDDDWLPETDTHLSLKYQVPLEVLPLVEGALRDYVHPNDVGKDLYADVLLRLIRRVTSTAQDFSSLASARRFDAFKISDLIASGGNFRDFSRADFRARMLSLEVGKTIEIRLPRKVKLTGLVILMGPTVGTIKIRTGERGTMMNCFDCHCYYERVNGRSLNSEVTDRIWLTQQAELPTEEIIKGQKNTDARVGGVSHILYEM